MSLFELTPDPANEGAALLFPGDLTATLVAEAEATALATAEGRQPGPLTGFQQLDNMLGRCLHHGVHQLQGAPGAGKTAFGLQVAGNCGCPALYITTEMSPVMLWQRTVTRITGRTDLVFLPPEEVRTLSEQTAAAVPMLAFLDGTRSFADPKLIADAITLLRTRFDAQHALVVLDSLQDWAKSTGVEASEYERVSQASRTSQQLAQQQAVPLLAIAHRNRSGQQKGGLHAGKGSGDLEYAAESVLELTTEEEYLADRHRPVTLTIHKNRHGFIGVDILLQFDAVRQEFTV